MRFLNRLFYFSMLLSCNQLDKKNIDKATHRTQQFDTVAGFPHNLKNDYKTIVLTDSSFFYLYLLKDSNKKLISSTEYYHHINSLGWEEADYDSSFVLVKKYGGGFPGNPMPCELIEKSTGNNLLNEDRAFFIDADEKSQLLLYSEKDVPDISDSLTWKDVKNNIEKKYPFPKEIFAEAGVLNRLKINKIGKHYFELKYLLNRKEKIKRYQK